MDAAQIAAKLTPAQVRALQWFKTHGPIGWYPMDAPIRSVRNRLWLSGLVEELPRVNLQVVKTQVSALGRAVLAALDAKEAGNE